MPAGQSRSVPQPVRVRKSSKPAPAPKPKEKDPEVPQTAVDAMLMGLEDAKLNLQKTGQRAMNSIQGSKIQNSEEILNRLDKRQEAVNEARDQFYGGDGIGGYLTEAAVRLPGNMINTAADVIGPTKKMAAVNAAYHTGRKYAETGSARQALVAGASNLAGEKVEDVLGRLPFMPKNLAGNAVGTVMERAANAYLDGRDKPAAKEVAPPTPEKLKKAREEATEVIASGKKPAPKKVAGTAASRAAMMRGRA